MQNNQLLILTTLLLALASPGPSVAGDDTFTNPILRGGFPDPSICRVGDDYYIVNSTFEYFPGLPIHHSKDLVNWELVGYGLHREEQASGAVNLVDVQSNGGIHAPTIRCQDGMFYIITTNVYLPPGDGAETEFINFVITADDPRGPWSEPYVIDAHRASIPTCFSMTMAAFGMSARIRRRSPTSRAKARSGSTNSIRTAGC